MSRIRAVFFDLDDTLLWDERSVDEAFEATCRLGAERAGIDEKRLEGAVKEAARELYAKYETFEFTKMIGINPFEGLWGNFTEGEHPMFRSMQRIVPQYRKDAWTQGLRACGVDDPELGALLGETFPAERRKRPLYYEETLSVLDALKGKYRLLLLTNGSPDLQAEKLSMAPELPPYFEQIVISGNFGRGKPAVELFRHALELMKLEPGEAIMVGDKLTTDIQGANNVGMTSVWINHHGKTRTDEDAKPDFEIKRLNGLLDVLNQLK